MYLGIDVGTSGVRCCVLNKDGVAEAQSRVQFPDGENRQSGVIHEQSPAVWWDALSAALDQLPHSVREQCRHLSLDATSGTVLALDQNDEVLGRALMYNDSRAQAEAGHVESAAPKDSAAHGASSGLAKILWLKNHYPNAVRFLHQADWLIGKLLGHFQYSDENNTLKSGYDPVTRSWPDWLGTLGVSTFELPDAQLPGHPLGRIASHMAQQLGLSDDLVIHAGTTDSIAAFLASPACKPGDAVTSLGSTLAIKLISDKPIFAPEFGIYSHRLGPWWLVGGASNSGGKALLRYFSEADLETLSAKLPLDQPDPHYYPLPAQGERFPVADAQMESRVDPRPANKAAFLQGLLQGLARIEALAYERLNELGAPSVRRIFTSGGGSNNAAWLMFRQQCLPCPVLTLKSAEPSCGAARLSMGEFSQGYKT